MAIFELFPEYALEALTYNFSLREHDHLFALATEPGRIHDLTLLHRLPADLMLHLPELDYSIICRQELQGAAEGVLFRTTVVQELDIVNFLFQLD